MRKILYLNVNNSCNNNCIGCAVDPNIQKNEYRSLSSIKEELKEGVKQGYRIFHPIGGEITLHPDLLEILAIAKELGYKTVLTSNGRFFSYKGYIKKVKGAVSSFNITLFGATEKIHESWTRTRGSFKQTIKGIKNLLEADETVCLNIPIWSGNIKQLDDYLFLVDALKIRELGILMLGPFGRLKDDYNKYSPSLLELTSLNYFLFKAKELVDTIDVEDFPLCIFRDSILNTKKIHFQDISSSLYIGEDGRIETLGLFAALDKGYSTSTTDLNKEDTGKLKDNIESFKHKFALCKKCILSKSCKGLYKAYFKGREKKEISQEFLKLFKISNRLPVLVLVVTYKCNLDCKYCITVKKEESISFKTAKKSLDLLLNLKSPFYYVRFFGGEPLLELDLVKRIIHYATSKNDNTKFVLTTNGVLLTKEIINYFRLNNVELRVSVDGKDKWQTKNRGKKSSKVIKVLTPFVDYVSLNMVVSNNNCGNFFENFKYLYNKGFRKFNFLPAFYDDWHIKDFKVLESEMQKIRDFLVDKEIDVINKEVWQDSYLFTRGWCIDCNGDIYSNNKFIMQNQPQKRIANVMDISDFGQLGLLDDEPEDYSSKEDKMNLKLDNLFNIFIEGL